MDTSPIESTVATNPIGAAPRKRRVYSLAIISLALIALAVAGGYLFWKKNYSPRTPPTVDVAKLDPEVVESVNAHRKAVLKQPRSAEAWGELAAVFRAHDLAPANACFAEAQRLDETDYRWPYLIGQSLAAPKPEIGISRLRRAVELCGDEPAPRLTLAEVLLERGELAEAEALFQKATGKSPLVKARAQLGLGRIALQQNKIDLAVERLRAAVQGAPGAKSAHVALAQAYRRQGNEAGAELEQRNAAILKAEDTSWPDPCAEFIDHFWVGMRARMHRINLLDTHGMREESVVAARQMVFRYPESALARLILGEMLNKSGSYRPAEAALRESLRLDPERAKTYFELGYALQAQGKSAEAVEPYRKSLEKRADFAPAHFNLALALQALKDEPGALEELKAAVRYQPEYADAHLALSAMLEKQGQHQDALTHAEQAVRSAPSDPRAKRVLADLQAKDAKP